jgi:hypothetical protein
MNTKQQNYDLIGDIHGQANELLLLLEKLGYKPINDIWQHPTNKVIFLGDFIDRGILQKQTIDIVRPMIENGYALSVIGNHEYNAILYHTKHQNNYLRPHTKMQIQKHSAFVNDYADFPEELLSVIDWFKTLPIWIEFDNLRVIHACWNNDLVNGIKNSYGGPLLNDDLIYQSSIKESWQHNAVEDLIKGKEILIPDEFAFTDPDGEVRTNVRIKWWLTGTDSLRQFMLGGFKLKESMPDLEITNIGYPINDKPLFIGHYWFNDRISILADNVACLDYSIATPNGKLVAYRWSGEQTLNNNNFISVDRIQPTIDLS